MGNLLEPIQHRGTDCDTSLPIDRPRLALSLAEMGLDALAMLACLLLGRLLLRVDSFARSLKLIFANLLFASFNIAWTRLFLLVPQYIANGLLFSAAMLKPIQVFHDICVNVNTWLQLSVTFECLLSSLCVRLHARLCSSAVLALLNGGWPWLAALLLYAFEDFIPTVPQFLFFEALNLLSWLIFLLLYFYNRRKYRRMEAGQLDRKYQVIIKIRTLRTLLFLSALTSLRNLITCALLIVIIQILAPNCLFLAILYCGHSFDLTVAIYSSALVLPMVLTHPELRKQFRKLRLSGCCWSQKDSRPPSAMRVTAAQSRQKRSNQVMVAQKNVLGETLNFRVSTPDGYFRQLEQCWATGAHQQQSAAQPPSTILHSLEESRRRAQARKERKMVRKRLNEGRGKGAAENVNGEAESRETDVDILPIC